jgi:hypothetical protein
VRPQFWQIRFAFEDACDPVSDEVRRALPDCRDLDESDWDALPRLRRVAIRYSFSSRSFLFMFWTAAGIRSGSVFCCEGHACCKAPGTHADEARTAS